MPETAVYFYKHHKGTVPVRDWLKQLQRGDRQAFARCVAAVHQLARFGHELRRPKADYLRDGIYELRAKKGRVNHRVLYFFHGKNVALLAHALTKEDVVPDVDINRALERKKLFERDPARHTYEEGFNFNAET